jgi:hypothetical protein
MRSHLTIFGGFGQAVFGRNRRSMSQLRIQSRGGLRYALRCSPYLSWAQGVAGSNPVAPTKITRYVPVT